MVMMAMMLDGNGCENKKDHNDLLIMIERFSYDLEMKTREQNRNNKRTEIERFDWLYRTDTNAPGFWLAKRTLG